MLVTNSGGHSHKQEACRVLCGGNKGALWKSRSGLSGRWDWFGSGPTNIRGVRNPYPHFTPE